MADKKLTKYEEALSKYNTALVDAEVNKEVKELIEKKYIENDTTDVKKLDRKSTRLNSSH